MGLEQAPRREDRRVIFLIGAPSGAGKTTLAKQMVRKGIATQNYDFKALPSEIGTHAIIEISTNKWDRTVVSRNWMHLLNQLDDFDLIYCIHVLVPSRKELAKRYLKRLAATGGINRLKPRAWVHGLRYLCTNKLTQSEQAWRSFEDYLLKRYPDRVVTMEQPT